MIDELEKRAEALALKFRQTPDGIMNVASGRELAAIVAETIRELQRLARELEKVRQSA